MRAPLALLLAVLATLGSAARPADAAPAIAVESHVGERPADAERHLGPVLDALAAAGVRLGPTLGAAYAAAASSAAGAGDPATAARFAALVEEGQTAWFDARIDDTRDRLAQAVTLAADTPAVALDPAGRTLLFQARVILALASQKAGRADEAAGQMQAVVRSFPDLPVTRGQFGPDAEALFARARTAVTAMPRGVLEITAGGNAQLFVDTRLAGTSTARLELPPGDYRVLVRAPGTPGRVYPAQVSAGTTTRLEPTLALDAVLRTTPPWVGLAYATADARAAADREHAAAVARTLGAELAYVLRFEERDELAVLVGVAVRAADGGEARRAELVLGPVEPDEARLRGFADSLLGGATAAPLPMAPREPSGRRLAPWALLGAGGAALATAAVLLALDQDAVEDGVTRPTYRDTGVAAAGAAAVGVALAATGAIWLLRDRGDDAPAGTALRPAVAPTAGGLVLGLAGAL